jgi:hypothetical protein
MAFGRFDSMQNTPTGCGSHLPTILRTLNKSQKSRSENNLLKCSDLGPEESKRFLLPARMPARRCCIDCPLLCFHFVPGRACSVKRYYKNVDRPITANDSTTIQWDGRVRSALTSLGGGPWRSSTHLGLDDFFIWHFGWTDMGQPTHMVWERFAHQIHACSRLKCWSALLPWRS